MTWSPVAGDERPVRPPVREEALARKRAAILVEILRRLARAPRPCSVCPPVLHSLDGPREEKAEALAVEEIKTASPRLLDVAAAYVLGGRSDPWRCLFFRLVCASSRRRGIRLASALLERRTNGLVAWEAAVYVGRTFSCAGEAEEEGLVDALLACAREWRGWGRQYPIWALAALQVRRAAGVIGGALLDDDCPAVQRHSVKALAELLDSSAAPWLREFLRRPPSRTDELARKLAGAFLRRESMRLPGVELRGGPAASPR